MTTTPHNATSFHDPSWHTPAETAAQNAAVVDAAQDSYAGSFSTAVKDYELRAGERPGPDPVITNLNPYERSVGSGSFSVTVNGQNFYTGWSVVVWDGGELATTVVSSTQLTVTAPGKTVVGPIEVYVKNSAVSRSAVVTFDFKA